MEPPQYKLASGWVKTCHADDCTTSIRPCRSLSGQHKGGAAMPADNGGILETAPHQREPLQTSRAPQGKEEPCAHVHTCHIIQTQATGRTGREGSSLLCHLNPRPLMLLAAGLSHIRQPGGWPCPSIWQAMPGIHDAVTNKPNCRATKGLKLPMASSFP